MTVMSNTSKKIAKFIFFQFGYILMFQIGTCFVINEVCMAYMSNIRVEIIYLPINAIFTRTQADIYYCDFVIALGLTSQSLNVCRAL